MSYIVEEVVIVKKVFVGKITIKEYFQHMSNSFKRFFDKDTEDGHSEKFNKYLRNKKMKKTLTHPIVAGIAVLGIFYLIHSFFDFENKISTLETSVETSKKELKINILESEKAILKDINSNKTEIKLNNSNLETINVKIENLDNKIDDIQKKQNEMNEVLIQILTTLKNK